jgi:GTP cyclohydrolase I
MNEETRIQALIRELIQELGEDVQREGLRKTPERVEKAMRFLTSGYQSDAQSIIEGALFESDCDEMVIVKDIEIYSLCEHHMLPFHGKCHVAYIPRGRIVGLSKIPRVVDTLSRRLQLQERLTHQVASTLMENLRPEGVGVVIEAIHLCMAMRGVEKQRSYAITSAMLGSFRDDRATRNEFLDLIRHRRS